MQEGWIRGAGVLLIAPARVTGVSFWLSLKAHLQGGSSGLTASGDLRLYLFSQQARCVFQSDTGLWREASARRPGLVAPGGPRPSYRSSAQ